MGFQETVITGLAPDGGLLVPKEIPNVTERLSHWSTLSYQEITFEILRLFVDLPDEDLRDLIERSYAPFRHPEVAPAVKVGELYILELFYGPTLAFKDIALQFLSNFFEYILSRRGQHMNVLAATSGDTGSAAIQGIKGRGCMNIFVMHPQGRISPLQEKQMTSVLDPNVYNLAIEGTFDDCQQIMKSIFRDLSFKQECSLGAVNSVNWARVLAQIVYYFSAGLYVMNSTGCSKVSFAIPTGNFGNILAGYYAARMGLPVDKLVLATNENDILSRFFNTGLYAKGKVKKTISPSMDIQVASNFERYLYYKLAEDHALLRDAMQRFREQGEISLSLEREGELDPLICAGVGNTQAALKRIRDTHSKHHYMLDPHTAVGVSVASTYQRDDVPMICLATAHPAKFSRAIQDATGEIVHHEVLDRLDELPTRCQVVPAEEQAVRDFIKQHTA